MNDLPPNRTEEGRIACGWWVRRLCLTLWQKHFGWRRFFILDWWRLYFWRPRKEASHESGNL